MKSVKLLMRILLLIICTIGFDCDYVEGGLILGYLYIISTAINKLIITLLIIWIFNKDPYDKKHQHLLINFVTHFANVWFFSQQFTGRLQKIISGIIIKFLVVRIVEYYSGYSIHLWFYNIRFRTHFSKNLVAFFPICTFQNNVRRFI